MNKHIITYQPHLTIKKFHQDNSLVRGLMGPLGSGKSTGCCYELMKRILEHPINPKTKQRESLSVVIRNTYKELKDTTLRSWLNLFPENYFGVFHWSDMIHKIRTKDVVADVLFRALDKPGDESKLLSLEATFIFVNEAREINYNIIQMLPRRLRFPSRSIYPEYFKGIIMDTNPPDVDHWWYKIFEETRPKGWQLFKQPSGISKLAENLANLPKGYYKEQMDGANPEWLRVYRDGQYGFVSDYKAVYPEYNDQLHCKKIKPINGVVLIVGMDFGRTPAAVFTQKMKNGQWLVFDELITWDTGALEFAKLLNDKINKDFNGLEVEYYGDPAGNQKSQTDSQTVYTSLAAGGIIAQPAISNSSLLRKEVLRNKLLSHKKQTDIKNEPAFLIDPKCKILRKGLIGGYNYRRMRVAGDERYYDKPEKNKYSHPVEALEYAMLGGREDVELTTMAQNERQRTENNWPSKLTFDPYWHLF
ncbi:MAG: phage terminase large subunit [SAR324 cluster bacterium]|nr:phage terminase large subunit [SAR324 cluster bacterium]